jgi:hemerythrin
MQAISWQAGIILGVHEVDVEHIKLFTCISDLEQALDAGCPFPVLIIKAHCLHDVFQQHCDAEERFLSQLEATHGNSVHDHRVGHQKFTETLHALITQMEARQDTRDILASLQAASQQILTDLLGDDIEMINLMMIEGLSIDSTFE